MCDRFGIQRNGNKSTLEKFRKGRRRAIQLNKGDNTTMFDNFFTAWLRGQIPSIVRAGLNALGGYLTANNLLTAEQGDSLIAALFPLVINVVALIWTYVENRNREEVPA